MMTVPILVEPVAGSFRATAGGPLELSAQGGSAVEAVNALRAKIDARLTGGSILIEQPVKPSQSPIPVIPLSENPLFDDWLKAVEVYRNEREAEESHSAGEPE